MHGFCRLPDFIKRPGSLGDLKTSLDSVLMYINSRFVVCSCYFACDIGNSIVNQWFYSLACFWSFGYNGTTLINTTFDCQQ
jgi:phospholipase C